METETKLPPVKLKLVGQDGNAYLIMGRFQAAARKAGWPKAEIEKVLDDARSSDYNHLLYTIMKHTKGN